MRPGPRRKQVQERLGRLDHSEQVHLELLSPLLERQVLDRPAHRYPGVVHQTVERLAAQSRCDRVARRAHLRRIGHVQQERTQAVPELGAQRLAIALASHTREHDGTPTHESAAHARPMPVDAPVTT